MTEPKRPLKVFLCHASADKPRVRELYRTLRRRGMQPWLDAEDLIPGQNWEVEIPKALYSSDAIIICLTPNSVDKEGYVQKEIKFALDKAMEMPEGRIFIIPARFEECELPFGLRQYQAVNLYEKAGYTKLMKALKLRASQLERVTVELPKVRETTAEIKKVVEEKKPPEPKEEKEQPKPEKPQPKKTKSPRKPNTTIIVALIGLVGTIIAALLGSPIIEKWFSPAPVSTESATATITMTFQSVIPSKTIEPSQTPTKSVALTPTSLPTEITDANGVSMVLVPAGEFIMGSDSGYEDEKPALTVFLDSYYIDKYEVTNRIYEICVDDGACQPPWWNGSRERGYYYGNSEFNEYPVIEVTWDMAKTFCEWRELRFPTEAEWEKAARGTDGRIYPWGDGIDCTYANYDGIPGCKDDTIEVGSYEKGKSPYGVYDMAGNVSEWVADWYDMNYYTVSSSSNPKGPESGEERVIRGGSWFSGGYLYGKNNVRATSRDKSNPENISYYIGFRCAKDATP